MRNRRIACDFEDLRGEAALAVASPGPLPGDLAADFGSAVLGVLLDEGVPASTAARALIRLEPLIEQERFSLAGEALRRLATRLEGTASAVALRRVISGADGRSLADDAKAAGCSKQRMHTLVKRAERQITAVVGGELTAGANASDDARKKGD